MCAKDRKIARERTMTINCDWVAITSLSGGPSITHAMTALVSAAHDSHGSHILWWLIKMDVGSANRADEPILLYHHQLEPLVTALPG